MCLIIFDWQPHAERMLTLASNRDEFYQRPSEAAHFWHEHPGIFGGRDLKMAGTWLAVSRTQRLAAVTNYRAPDTQNYQRSRGEIPFNFLTSSVSAEQFAVTLEQQQHEFAGFNALLFDGQELVYCSNRASPSYWVLPPGRYGLSNHVLNTPWPKVERATRALEHLSGNTTRAVETLRSALQDRTIASDYRLPNTGVSLEWERMLSAIFIQSPGYGTRASSVVIMQQSGRIDFVERSYSNHPDKPSMNHYSDQWQVLTDS